MTQRKLAMAAALLIALSAAPARAVFHLAVIDEVVTSHGGDTNVQFIEMRMLASVQNAVTNSVFAAFDASGNYVGDVLVVPGNVANSGIGVRWLVATSGFQTLTGLAPDFVMPAGVLPSGGGMLCYGGGGGLVPAAPGSWSRTDFATYVDCVAYGTYSGPSNVRIGTPTTLDGDGHSLQRIGSTSDNAADFACGDPSTPENNSGATVSLPATSPCPAVSPACPASPDLACTDGFAKGLLLVKEASGKEKLVAKMVRGPALAQTDLGDPTVPGGTRYDACFYDDAGALAGQIEVDRAGADCVGKPCWKSVGKPPPNGKGYKFKDKSRSSDGVALLLYKGGAAGKSKLVLKGKGSALPAGLATALQSASSVTMQLHGSDAPQCLSVTLSNIVKQESDFFKAK